MISKHLRTVGSVQSVQVLETEQGLSSVLECFFFFLLPTSGRVYVWKRTQDAMMSANSLKESCGQQKQSFRSAH